MDLTYAVNAAVVALVLAVLGGLKLARAGVMTRQAEHLGYSPTAFALIGLAELAGTAGLTVGLWVPPVGVAAATGIVLLLALATRAHLRSGDPPVRALGAVWLGAVALVVAVTGVLR